jgi:hypothetical protein
MSIGSINALFPKTGDYPQIAKPPSTRTSRGTDNLPPASQLIPLTAPFHVATARSQDATALCRFKDTSDELYVVRFASKLEARIRLCQDTPILTCGSPLEAPIRT